MRLCGGSPTTMKHPHGVAVHSTQCVLALLFQALEVSQAP